ncbi:MAG: CDP-2,3-bis-(O-geranylgeranyl)-sn-glycerol synthase [Nitrososphaerota archaeon]
MQDILTAIVYVLPAYVANGAPVVILRLIGSGHPIDRGKTLRDGRRLLGDGKTLEGLVSGLATGLLTAIAIQISIPWLYRGPPEYTLLPVGAMVGDLLGSFLKRRIGLERGRPAPVLDQLGFMAAALLLASLPYGPPSWLDSSTLTLILLVTAILHVSTNALAYLAGLKDKWY